jgi:hypothetical protein
VLYYSASNETDISNICFSSSLATLPSFRSSGRSNNVRWLVHLLFSKESSQQQDVREVATRTTACGSHHTPADTLTAADCSSHPTAVGVVPLLQIKAESSIASQPQSSTLAESFTNARIMG